MRGTAAMPSCVASGGEKRAVGAHTGMPVVSVCGPLGCFPLSVVVVVVIVRLAGDVKRESNKPLEEMENGAEKKCLGDAGSVTQSCSVPPMWVLCGTRDVSTACVGLGLCVGGGKTDRVDVHSARTSYAKHHVLSGPKEGRPRELMCTMSPHWLHRVAVAGVGGYRVRRCACVRCECKRLRSDGDLHTVACVPAVSTMVGVMGNMSRNRCGTRIFICGEGMRCSVCVCRWV